MPRMTRPLATHAGLLLLAGLLSGCAGDYVKPDSSIPLCTLETVAQFPGKQITGVAVSRQGRIFVSSPRWHDDFDGLSVASLSSDGALSPFPDAAWNAWTAAPSNPSDDPAATPADPLNTWVCVQSVHVDLKNRLWVLDPASPKLAGVIPGAAKLVELDPKSGKVNRIIRFDDTVAPTKSYLNDVRIDTETETAYLTDSGLGGIIVVNLADGASRRFLDNDPSVLADDGLIPVVGGIPLRFGGTPDGAPLVVHSDGIALDQVRGHLYWQSLTGKTLHRIRTKLLREAKLTPDKLAAEVENLGSTLVTDGMEVDEKANLYYTALEKNALILRIPDGRQILLAQDERLAWPDSLAFGPSGTLYVSTARIHQTAWFNSNSTQPDPQTQPFGIYKIKLPLAVRQLPQRP